MICINCVTPEVLKKLISESGDYVSCEYCGNDGVGVGVEFLFDYILSRVSENTATEDDLSQYEYGMLFEGGADDIPIDYLDIVLSEWANLGDESYFDDLNAYAPKEMKVNSRNMDRQYFGDDGLLERNFFEAKWINFIDDIQHSHRFFNPNTKGFLDSVFNILCGDDGNLKDECIRAIIRGEPVYRARSASTREQIMKIIGSPSSELGPTPKGKAGSQRMTPNGISAMYCSLERETCLSEIRSITGDNVVSIAMTPVTSLKFLDLTRLDQIEFPTLSLLDKGYLELMHLKTFMSSLVKKMSKPKGYNDELRYLSSQVVFEYLRLRFGSQVDGLIFPSVQTGELGTNIALFPEASIVAAKEINSEHEELAEASVITQSVSGAKLYCIPDSLRYHKITAIETKALEYRFSEDLFMTDLTRNRLGLH
ncbi:RES family NAD+ phosphorylase [Pseudomonas sp. ADAK2]|nr:RES family NAD+ phosphorylase [Pseudomonas sp. ADAK7]QJI51775.1 RES family NAD+ phosphorylase [Pseudomonas sp. ADAK2]